MDEQKTNPGSDANEQVKAGQDAIKAAKVSENKSEDDPKQKEADRKDAEKWRSEG